MKYVEVVKTYDAGGCLIEMTADGVQIALPAWLKKQPQVVFHNWGGGKQKPIGCQEKQMWGEEDLKQFKKKLNDQS